MWASWRGRERTTRGANADARHRTACGHFFAALVLPGAVIGSVQCALAWSASRENGPDDDGFYIASALGSVVPVNARDPGGAFGLRIHRGRVLAASVEDRPLPRRPMYAGAATG